MANETYISKGTALLINGEAGADYALTAEGLANTTGRVSAQIDLGAAPRAGMFTWSCEVQFQATPSQYGTLDIYVAGAPDADSTQIDGDIGTADAALGDIDMIYNLKHIGEVFSENAAASEKCVASGIFDHFDRYLSVVLVNNSGASINGTDSNFRFDLVPVSWQVQ